MPNPSSISFIVPVYNVAPYLDECLESIVASSQRLDEIILINDGSTDNSGEICRDWAQKQPDLIRLIEQPNQGLSAARNNALSQASCPYILFMDSDDVVIPSSINKVRPILEENAPDITLMDFCWWMPDQKDKQRRSPICSHTAHQLLTDRDEFCKATYNDLLLSACSRIFKRSLLLKMAPNVFPIGKAYEEISSIPRLTQRARTLYYLNEVLFNYRVRSGSITQSKTEKHCTDLSNALNQAIKEIRSLGLNQSVELAANMAAAKLMMTAIRDCGLVPHCSMALYKKTLNLGYSTLSLPVDEICAALDASTLKTDKKTSKHLKLSSRAPSLFMASRKLVYSLKRRKLNKARQNE